MSMNVMKDLVCVLPMLHVLMLKEGISAHVMMDSLEMESHAIVCNFNAIILLLSGLQSILHRY